MSTFSNPIYNEIGKQLSSKVKDDFISYKNRYGYNYAGTNPEMKGDDISYTYHEKMKGMYQRILARAEKVKQENKQAEEKKTEKPMNAAEQASRQLEILIMKKELTEMREQNARIEEVYEATAALHEGQAEQGV